MRVAVLGGGPAALTTACALTATPDLRARHEVTVYTLGWRLGGKGASGRNAAYGQRIEEHGLHVWFGFYDNAFALIRSCYQELGRPPGTPLANWRDAFKPHNDCVQFERFRGEWVAHHLELPPNPLTPGDPADVSFWHVVHRALAWLEDGWSGHHEHEAAAAGAGTPPVDESRLHHLARELEADLTGWTLRPALRLLGLARSLAEVHAAGHRAEHEQRDLADAGHLLGGVRDWLWKHVVADLVEDKELRLAFMWLDLAATSITGIAADRLRERGFQAVNDEEFLTWLRRHGATQLTVDGAPMVRAIYDAAFCFEHGDTSRPDVAAGKALQDFIRGAFLYKGALLYKMQAGMGDTVFTPLYQVLRARGVRFEFFSCVTRLTTGGGAVTGIEIVPQATVRSGDYQPLVDVKGLACWPSEPDWSQLEEGERLRGTNLELETDPLGLGPFTLRRGDDFDVAVLGIPVGALPPICGDLAAAQPRFAAMLDGIPTVMTQAFQLWLHPDAAALGWPYPAGSLSSCYVEPLDTYCDMSHLIAREDWDDTVVGHVAYFCGVLPDSSEAGDDQVEANLRSYLANDIRRLWPAFDESMLVGGVDGQYWRANTSGSERYALTTAGSVECRLWPDESGFEGLVLAGDWTRNGIDGGSVEAAVTSGLLAARAISGEPAVVRGTAGWLESDLERRNA